MVRHPQLVPALDQHSPNQPPPVRNTCFRGYQERNALSARIIASVFMDELYPRNCSAVFGPQVTSNNQTFSFLILMEPAIKVLYLVFL